MQAQSTRFSQKLSKFNQILGVLALCAVTGSLVATIAVSAQTSESSIMSSPTSSVSKSSSSSVTAMSQNQNSSQTISRISNQVIPIATFIFVGELDHKEGNSIFVSKDNQVKQYNVTSDIKVRRDSMESNIAMLKVGDTLTINQSQDGQKIFSIDAISKQSNDLIKWGIAAAVLALIIIPLIIYLLSRTKKGHIHTSTSIRN